MNRILTAHPTIVVCLLLSLDPLCAQDFTFTKIADTSPGSGVFALYAHLAINNSGTVAFTAGTRVSGPIVQQVSILRGAGGPLTSIANTDGSFRQLAVGSLNTSGTVAFYAADARLQGGIYTGSGAALNTIALFSSETPLTEATPDINDVGLVSFQSNTRIWTATQAPARLVWDMRNRPFESGLTTINCHALSPRGDIIFRADTGGSAAGLYLLRGTNLSPVETAAGPLRVLGGQNCAVNDAGQTAFAAITTGGEVGIYVAKLGDRTQLIFRQGEGSPTGLVAVNELGTVAYGTEVFAGRGQSAIFSWNEQGTRKVIAVGDELFGSRVRTLPQRLANQGGFLNDQGQIAFIYALADGTAGIAVATPRQTPPTGGTSPQLPQDSIVNAASLSAGVPPSPGSVVSIFGANFANSLTVASTPELPTDLNGVRVTFNGIPAPLYFVSPNQINAQIPYELTGTSPRVVVSNAFGQSESRVLPLENSDPAIYSLNQSGRGQGAILIANTSLVAGVTGQPGVAARPARPGETITIYANGMGAVTPSIANGVNSCGGVCAPDASNLTLRRVVNNPTVIIDGSAIPSANVLFAGLAPQFVGLYQVNVTLPANVPTGNAVSVVLRQGERRSRGEITMAIQR
jgi:uncharacterized protein (TIGR03437 family)